MNDERARLFVALELPGEVRDALVRWRTGAVEEGVKVRAVPAEDLHVTLAFLGWRARADVDGITEACAVLRGCAAANLSLGEAAVLPRRRPRVLAVALDDPAGALGAAQSAVSDALAAAGYYEPERRPFYAHVTVARAGRGARIPRSAALAEPPPQMPFRGSEVVLYRSRLHRSGASYEALARIALQR